MRYRSNKCGCGSCPMKRRCRPDSPRRKILRSAYGSVQDTTRDIAATDAFLVSRRERKKIEMLVAHLKRILRLDRLRLHVRNGTRHGFHLAAAAHNLGKLAKLIPMPALLTA